MLIRTRIISLGVVALMVYGWWNDRLGFWSFCLLVIVGGVLNGVVSPLKASVSDGADVIRIRRQFVQRLRNALLRHQNSRGADREYQESRAAQEDTVLLQALNEALQPNKKPLARTKPSV